VSNQIRQIRAAIPGARLALGSDASGLEHLPGPVPIPAVPVNSPPPNPPPYVVYADQPGAPSGALQRCTFGDRAWDYVREGMAHIGLLPDMAEQMYVSGRLTDGELADWFHSAEHFTQMWERAAARAAVSQHRWNWCELCSGLWYSGNGTRGRCQADAAGHHSNGSGDYLLKFSAAGGAGQDNWRWCARCQGIWFAGNPGLGACPAGVGGHTTAGSGAYRLEDVDHRDRPGGQDQWRWCNKCAGLFFDGNSPGTSGRCPWDNAFHSRVGSGNYVLRQI
jgi:hypothetical protein